ncbi:hypothetical protein [Novipirellula sp.]|uniref:hypothetical protein n=1 Tax=Novipirellula sp. TaxID=2795430 RepID=UPI00356530D5
MANHLKIQRNRKTDAFRRRTSLVRLLAIGIATLTSTHNTFAKHPVSTIEPAASESAAKSNAFQQSSSPPIQMATEFDVAMGRPPAFQPQPSFNPSVWDDPISTIDQAAVGGEETFASETAIVNFVSPDSDPLFLGDPAQHDTDTLLGSGSSRQQASSDAASRDAALDRELNALMKPIEQIAVGLGERGKKVPENVATELGESTSFVVLATGATLPKPDRYTVGFCHKPLYFEQANLERCGNHYGVFQNAVSGLGFLCDVRMLPYHSVATPACHCVSSPGDCLSCEMMPKQVNPFPIEPKAAMLEAAAIAGFILLLQ